MQHCLAVGPEPRIHATAWDLCHEGNLQISKQLCLFGKPFFEDREDHAFYTIHWLIIITEMKSSVCLLVNKVNLPYMKCRGTGNLKINLKACQNYLNLSMRSLECMHWLQSRFDRKNKQTHTYSEFHTPPFTLGYIQNDSSKLPLSFFIL